jgi:hypothetical protein
MQAILIKNETESTAYEGMVFQFIQFQSGDLGIPDWPVVFDPKIAHGLV